MYMGGEDRLGRIQRNVGQDREVTQETPTHTVIYYCQEHGCSTTQPCGQAQEIGWVEGPWHD